jgi:hypothetical protein
MIAIVTVSSSTFVQLGLRRIFEGHPGAVVVGECPRGAVDAR